MTRHYCCSYVFFINVLIVIHLPAVSDATLPEGDAQVKLGRLLPLLQVTAMFAIILYFKRD